MNESPDEQQEREQAETAYQQQKQQLEEQLGTHDTHLSLPALRNRLAWQREEEEAWR